MLTNERKRIGKGRQSFGVPGDLANGKRLTIGQAYLTLVDALTEGEQVAVVLSVIEGVQFNRDRVPR